MKIAWPVENIPFYIRRRYDFVSNCVEAKYTLMLKAAERQQKELCGMKYWTLNEYSEYSKLQDLI